jgi:hypothetical protein
MQLKSSVDFVDGKVHSCGKAQLLLQLGKLSFAGVLRNFVISYGKCFCWRRESFLDTESVSPMSFCNFKVNLIFFENFAIQGNFIHGRARIFEFCSPRLQV